MNILFITLANINNVNESGIYSDLMRELAKNNNRVYIVSPVEKRYKMKTKIIHEDGLNDWHNNVIILKVKTGNIQKTNYIEKGISTLFFNNKIKCAIKKYFKKMKFDLLLYSTPPVTISNLIRYIKRRNECKSYLMLKDINPQSFLDLGALNKHGLKGIIYKYFEKKERELYECSDAIGCMSQANIDYLLKHNMNLKEKKVELFPNCIEPKDYRLNKKERIEIREKYGLPIDKKIFIYGGNLGKPQNIPFLIECLKKERLNTDIYFLIVGNGTDYHILEDYCNQSKNSNFKLLQSLPRDIYDKMIGACDYGMIFLDYRFTIPNFPSRLLSYMQAGLPIIACTDPNTDIGAYIQDNNIGFWCPSNDVNLFSEAVKKMMNTKFNSEYEIELLKKDFDVKKWSIKLEEFAK